MVVTTWRLYHGSDSTRIVRLSRSLLYPSPLMSRPRVWWHQLSRVMPLREASTKPKGREWKSETGRESSLWILGYVTPLQQPKSRRVDPFLSYNHERCTTITSRVRLGNCVVLQHAPKGNRSTLAVISLESSHINEPPRSIRTKLTLNPKDTCNIM